MSNFATAYKNCYIQHNKLNYIYLWLYNANKPTNIEMKKNFFCRTYCCNHCFRRLAYHPRLYNKK